MTSGVNYMNPASFIPQAAQWQSGPLGGIQYANQANDYRQLMEVQHFLQQLGAQQEQQKHNEFMAGAPIREMERTLKGETLQGQIPGARENASALQRQGTAQANFQTNTQFSPEAQRDYFRQLRQKASDDEWKQYGREIQAGGQLAQQALIIQHKQGDMAAQAYVQQQMQSLKRAGVNLPDTFGDPRSWAAVYETAKNSIPHLQALELEELKNTGRRDVANIQAGAARDAASIRANDNDKYNQEQELVRLQREVFSGNASPETIQQYTAQVFRKWQESVQKDPSLMSLAFQATQDTEKGKQAKQLLEQRRNEFMGNYGVRPVQKDPKPGETPAGAATGRSGVRKFGDLAK